MKLRNVLLFVGVLLTLITGLLLGFAVLDLAIPNAAAHTATNLHSFPGADGASPNAGLVQGRDGNFYGTTGVSARLQWGTVFELSVPLNPLPIKSPDFGS